MDLVSSIIIVTVVGVITLFYYLYAMNGKKTAASSSNHNNNITSNRNIKQQQQLPRSVNNVGAGKKKDKPPTNIAVKNATNTHCNHKEDTMKVYENVEINGNSQTGHKDQEMDDNEALPLDSQSVFVKRLSSVANGHTSSSKQANNNNGQSQRHQVQAKKNGTSKQYSNSNQTHHTTKVLGSNVIYTSEQLFQAIRESTLTKDENEAAVELLLNKVSRTEDEWRQQRNDPLQNLKRQLKEKEQALANQVSSHQITKKLLSDNQREIEKQNNVREVLNKHLELQQTLNQKIKTDADMVIKRLEQEKLQLQQALNERSNHNAEDHTRLQLQLNERNDTIRQYEETVRNLEQKLHMCEVQIKTISNARQRDDFNLRTKLSEMSKKMSELENDKIQTDVKAQDILQKFSESLSHMHSLEQKYEERGQLVHSLERQLKEALARHKDLLIEIDRLKIEPIERQKLSELRKNELTEEVRRLKLMLVDKEDALNTLSNEVSRNAESQNQMEQTNKDLINECALLRTTLTDMSERYEAEREKLMAQVDELSKRLESTETDKSKALREHEKFEHDARQALGEMEQELRELQKKLTVKSASYDERLKQEVSQVEEELTKAGEREKNLLQQVDQLRDALALLFPQVSSPANLDNNGNNNNNNASDYVQAINKLNVMMVQVKKSANEFEDCKQKLKALRIENAKLAQMQKVGLDSLRMEQQRGRQLEEELAKLKQAPSVPV